MKADLTPSNTNSKALRPTAMPVPSLTGEAWTEIARSLRLSGRECQILLGVFDDKTERTIAANLGISVRTVHAHIERLHRKLGVRTRSHLVQRVMWEYVALTAAADSKLDPICPNHAAGRCPLRA